PPAAQYEWPKSNNCIDTMRISLRLFVVVGFLLVPSLALGLGADHPQGQPVFGSDRWPKGLADLVNSPLRVHGYFVNETDVFFFAGDTDRLNVFLKSYSQLPDAKLRLVLHLGTLEVKSPWDKQPRDIKADWRLYASPYSPAQLAGEGPVQLGQFCP